MSDHSVTLWIEQLKHGSDRATQELWTRYYSSLLAVARRILGNSPKRAADEEDVVLAAFDSFFRASDQGKFPDVRDRDDLWHLLVAITERKALNQQRDQRRLKRGAGDVRGESALDASTNSGSPGIGGIAGVEPTPDFVAAIAENISLLMQQLTDEQSRIALLKLEGYTNAEIAQQLKISIATTERRLRRIRETWRGSDEEE